MQHDLAMYLLLLEFPLQRFFILLVLALILFDVLNEFLNDQVVGRLRRAMIWPREVIELDHFPKFDVLGLVYDYKAPSYQILHQGFTRLQYDLDRLTTFLERKALTDF